MFYQIAANLAGIQVTKAMIAAQQKYQPAMPEKQSIQQKNALKGAHLLEKAAELTPEEKI